MERAEYRAQRFKLEAQLATMQSTTHRSALLAKAADLLRNLPAAWESATPEQRSDLARLIFASVEIEDEHIVAIML